jgi:beta-N-acetylglucosaminidase
MKKVMKSLLLALVVFGSINLNLNATDDTNTSEVDFAVINETEEQVVVEESISYEIVPEETTEVQSRTIETESDTTETYMGTVVEKEEVNAGDEVLVFDTEGTVELTVNENDVLVQADETTTTDTFVVEDGQITSAEDAFFMTSGGVGETVNIYPSVEAASSGVDGTPINATADDGQYIETIDYNDEDFVHVEISGYEGYMYLDDVQIVPTDFAQAQSFYVLQNGQWYYNVAVDPLTSTEYVTYPMATTPEWAVENVKYYSSDDVTFVAESPTQNTRSVRSATTYASADYFQNLSIRSQSSYTAKNYNDYLEYVGASDSQYYNHTSAFVQAQEVKQINSLFLFAFANHESAYGKSYYSRQCNNFFGRGAYDSNPDNACVEFGYPTPEDGILSQAFFLQNNYLDTDEFLYYGGYPGNLAGGMNVKYATDPNWGKAIASHMYQTDKALGSKEVNKYRTVALTTSVPAYTTSAMTTNVKTDKGNNYYFETGGRSSGNPTGGRGGAGVRAIVVEETPTAMKVQIETPMNTGASGNYATTSARRGSYPNYEGNMNPVYVPNGATSYAVNYGDFSSQQVWVPKTVNGKQTYTVLNDVPVPQEPTADPKACILPPPVQNGEVYAFSKDGTVNCSKEYKNGVMVAQSVATFNNGVVVSSRREEFSDSGFPTKTIDRFYYPSGKEKTVDEYIINGSRKVEKKNISNYYESGQLKQYDTEYFASNGTLVRADRNFYDTRGKLTQITYDEYNKDSGKLTFTASTLYNSSRIPYFTNISTMNNGVAVKENVIYYDQQGRETLKIDVTRNNQDVTLSEIIYYYDADHNAYKISNSTYKDGKIYYYEDAFYQKNGLLTRQEIKEYSNGVLVKEHLYEYDNNQRATNAKQIEYYNSGKTKSVLNMEYTIYKGAVVPYRQTIETFKEDGKKDTISKYTFTNGTNTKIITDTFAVEQYVASTSTQNKNASGISTFDETYKYNASGKTVQYNKLTYNSDGSKKTENIKYYDENGNFIREETINY